MIIKSLPLTAGKKLILSTFRLTEKKQKGLQNFFQNFQTFDDEILYTKIS